MALKLSRCSILQEELFTPPHQLLPLHFFSDFVFLHTTQRFPSQQQGSDPARLPESAKRAKNQGKQPQHLDEEKHPPATLWKKLKKKLPAPAKKAQPQQQLVKRQPNAVSASLPPDADFQPIAALRPHTTAIPFELWEPGQKVVELLQFPHSHFSVSKWRMLLFPPPPGHFSVSTW